MARASRPGWSVSSGAIDILIPPSIAMILYGAAAEQSIPKLFVAGVLPGLLIALMMAAFVVVRAVQMDIPRSGRFDLRHFLCTSWGAVPALFMPAFVLGIIYFGYSSPTEAGGFACLYAMIVGRYVYRTMSWQDVLEAAARVGDADRADPRHRRDRGAVLLDPHHQRHPARDDRMAAGACSLRPGRS